jgi:hypothetical protein
MYGPPPPNRNRRVSVAHKAASLRAPGLFVAAKTPIVPYTPLKSFPFVSMLGFKVLAGDVPSHAQVFEEKLKRKSVSASVSAGSFVSISPSLSPSGLNRTFPPKIQRSSPSFDVAYAIECRSPGVVAGPSELIEPRF